MTHPPPDTSVAGNLGLVHRIVHLLAHRHQLRGLPEEDAVQAGVIGLLRAARGFDPSRGFQFSTYAWPCIRQDILNAVNAHAMITLPKDLNEALHAGRVNVSAKRIAWARRIGWEKLPPEDEIPARKAVAFEDADELAALLRRLNPRHRDILVQWCQGRTYAAIARDLGVTRERVRQIVEEALDRLRRDPALSAQGVGG